MHKRLEVKEYLVTANCLLWCVWGGGSRRSKTIIIIDGVTRLLSPAQQVEGCTNDLRPHTHTIIQTMPLLVFRLAFTRYCHHQY